MKVSGLAENPPPEATFRGTEYITYDLQQRSVEPILSTSDEISLYFKTRKSSGLLFYTGELNYSIKVLPGQPRMTNNQPG